MLMLECPLSHYWTSPLSCLLTGADPGFSNKRGCTSQARSTKSLMAGVQGPPKAPRSSLAIWASFWRILKQNCIKNIVDQTLKGARTCCAPIWICHWLNTAPKYYVRGNTNTYIQTRQSHSVSTAYDLCVVNNVWIYIFQHCYTSCKHISHVIPLLRQEYSNTTLHGHTCSVLHKVHLSMQIFLYVHG